MVEKCPNIEYLPTLILKTNNKNISYDGERKKDDIENLMALCRECHLEYGDIQEVIPTLQELHQKRMNK
jgi:hypothetical protein